MKGHPVGTLVREDHPVDDHFPGSSVWLRIVRWVPRVGSHGGWLCVTSAAPGNVLCEEWDGDLREGTKFEDMPVVGAIPGSDAERARVAEPTDLDPCYGNPVERCTNPGHGRGPTAPTAEKEAIGDACGFCGAPLRDLCAPLPDGGKACSVRCVDLHRLARAAGVDPKADDPVGAIEAAVRELREWAETDRATSKSLARRVAAFEAAAGIPEDAGLSNGEIAARVAPAPAVVTGAEAARLPPGSIVVRDYSEHDYAALDLAHKVPHVRFPLTRTPEGFRESSTDHRPDELASSYRFRVLLRGPTPEPEPARTLAVGDVIATGDELESLPLGAVVRDEGGLVGQRLRTGWAWVDPTQNEIGPYGKATVIDLPGGDES